MDSSPQNLWDGPPPSCPASPKNSTYMQLLYFKGVIPQPRDIHVSLILFHMKSEVILNKTHFRSFIPMLLEEKSLLLDREEGCLEKVIGYIYKETFFIISIVHKGSKSFPVRMLEIFVLS